MHVIQIPPELDDAALESLAKSLFRAATDDEARVWVLRASHQGGEVFCRGMDLEAIARSGERAAGSVPVYAQVLGMIRRAPRPTIALVEGEALGGGVGIAAACDCVIASASSRFGLPEGLFGIIPAMVVPILLERMTQQRIRKLAFECGARDAEWARDAGLIDDVVPDDAVEEALRRHARSLGRVATGAVKALRTWIGEVGAHPRDVALERGAERLAELLREPATRRALRAFVDEGEVPW